MEPIRFLDDDGTFTLNDPEAVSCLYFPLASEAGLKSAITPGLGGDCKLDQADLPTGAGELGKSPRQPEYPELLVRHGGGLLVGRGGIRPTGGRPLY